jgi:hypothetical protein
MVTDDVGDSIINRPRARGGSSDEGCPSNRIKPSQVRIDLSARGVDKPKYPVALVLR